MEPKLIDAHCHMNFKAFGDDADEVIQRAIDNDTWLINVGAARDTSEKAVEIAVKYDKGVYAIVGLHPIHDDEGFDYEFYKQLAQNDKVVGIGETGLDYFRDGEKNKDTQREIFEAHIRLSNELKKPLMLHVRDARQNDIVGQAYGDVLDVLSTNSYLLITNPGNAHFFAGDYDVAKKFLDLGFTLSFTGVITFTHDYDEVIKKIPLESILIETDAPYVAPVPFRGKRNEPSYVEHVARRIAEIKDESFEMVAETTTQNARRVFGIL